MDIDGPGKSWKNTFSIQYAPSVYCCKWLSRFNAKEYPRDGQDIGLALYLDYGQDLSAAF